MDKNLKQEAADEKTSGERLQELSEINEDLAVIVAQNPAAPPALLTKLYSSPNQNIRKNLAKNPNTPITVLWQLGIEFPEYLVYNPVLSLLCLENPDSVKQIPYEALIKLLKYEQIPNLWLDFASKQADKKIVLSMLMNPKTSLAQLNNLFKVFDESSQQDYKFIHEDEYQNAWEILYNIDYHINWEQELKEGWQEEALNNIVSTHYTDNNYKHYLINIFQFEITHLFHDIVNDSSNLIYKNVCYQILVKVLKFSHKEDENKNKIVLIEQKFLQARTTSNINILSQLLTEEDKHFKIKTAMLENPNLPQKILIEILDKLIIRTDSTRLIGNSLFRQILVKANIPGNLLEKMAQIKDNEWQLFVAEHPNTPISILEKYAQSSNRGIVYNVAKNPNTPKSILNELAADEWQIQQAVAANPSTPELILINFANQNNSYLCYNSNLPIAVFNILAKNSSNDSSLVYNPNTPKEILKIIAQRADDYRTRLRIIEHQNTDIEILKILAKDSDYEVRYNVAKNNKTPLHILEELAEDLEYKVRYGILMNPNLNKSDFLLLIRKIYNEECYSLGYLLALLDYSASSEFLEENSNSLLWIERYIIAIHPQTPLNVVKRLTKDANRYVRAAALVMYQRFQITQ